MRALRDAVAPIENCLEGLADPCALAAKVRASDFDQLARSTATDPPVPAAEHVANLIDHTLLKPEAAPEDIGHLYPEARRAAFAGVCVGVEASGGIRSRAGLERVMRADPDRMGTSSGVRIMHEYELGKA